MTTANEQQNSPLRLFAAPELPEAPTPRNPATTLPDSPLSAIYCPIPEAVHPAADRLNSRTLDWIRRYSLCAGEGQLRRLERAEPGRLTARVVPHGLVEPLQVFTDFHTWLFAFDDEYCDEESSSMSLADWIPFLSRLQRHVEAGPLDTLVSHPYAESLRDIAERLTPWCTPAQKARWFTALRMYFQALVWEAHSRSQGSGPAAGQSRTDEYILMRLDNGAMQSSIALLDMACGYELPTPERERPCGRWRPTPVPPYPPAPRRPEQSWK